MQHPDSQYTKTAIGLHWLIALLMLGTFIMGHVMSDMPFSPTKLRYVNWHKWAGVTILALAFIRLAWRLTHRPPALPAGMLAWQAKAAEGAHVFLYLLMFAIPLSGYFYSMAAGYPVVYFGVLPLPVLLEKNDELKALFKIAHIVLNYTVAGVVIVHALAALKHQFVERDGTLARMLPFLK